MAYDDRQADDYLHEIAAGRVPGVSAVLKFGENPDIDTASGFETIWDAGGTYVPPTTARLHNLASTLAADAGTLVSSGTATGGSQTSIEDTGATFVTDGVAVGDYVLNDTNLQIGIVTTVTSETELTMIGRVRYPGSGKPADAIELGDVYRVVTNASTGASFVHVQGLDINRLDLQEFVILNGVSNVATSGSFFRQFRMRAFGPNTTGAAGVITSTAQTDATVSCQIINGNNQTLMAVYTVPLNKIGYIRKWWGAMSGKTNASSVLHLRGGILDGIGYIIQNRTIRASGSSEFSYEPSVDIVLTGGADIWVEADSDTNDTAIASGFDIILEDL